MLFITICTSAMLVSGKGNIKKKQSAKLIVSLESLEENQSRNRSKIINMIEEETLKEKSNLKSKRAKVQKKLVMVGAHCLMIIKLELTFVKILSQ